MDNNKEYEITGVEAADSLPAKRTYRSEIYDWLQCIVSALLFCVLVFIFIARIIGVVGTSMVPTLYEGDKIFISNLFYGPKNGDVVVFRKESFRHEPLVKRVIATEGQTIDIDFESGVVTVDGVELREDYINELTHSRGDFQGPVTVPEGQLFVMGDNRNLSRDSREAAIGLIDERYVMGKVYFVVMPFSHIKRVG